MEPLPSSIIIDLRRIIAQYIAQRFEDLPCWPHNEANDGTIDNLNWIYQLAGIKDEFRVYKIKNDTIICRNNVWSSNKITLTEAVKHHMIDRVIPSFLDECIIDIDVYNDTVSALCNAKNTPIEYLWRILASIHGHIEKNFTDKASIYQKLVNNLDQRAELENKFFIKHLIYMLEI